MGQQIVKQPDGRLAVFSSVVDAFVIIDATPEEILEWRAEAAAKEARRTTQRQIDHVLADEPRHSYFQFTLTWEEALKKHREHDYEEGDDIFGDGEKEDAEAAAVDAACGSREPEPRTGTSPCVLPAGHGGQVHQDKWTNQWPVAAGRTLA